MTPRPPRVLHIVGGMVRGGIETWLMNILRHRDPAQCQMDFIVHTTEPGPYDDEARRLGSRIFPCLSPARPWEYARNFRRILETHGPFDVVHSHVHLFNGFTMRCARRAGIPVRIAHSHVDTMPEDVAPGLARRLYLGSMRRLIWKNATHGLAASQQAAAALFGAGWNEDPRFRLLFYGIDLSGYRAAPDPTVRPELGLPADAFVVGHIGRFDEQKNHGFLLEIAKSLAALEPRMRLLLIGAGSLRPAMEQRAAELGIADRVIFAGLRSDIARVLKGAVDVFVLPSLCEGLAIVLIEAQAAGLPCVFTNTIPGEATVVPALTTRVPLTESTASWAARILGAGRQPRPITQTDALATVTSSPFDIQRSVASLLDVYATATSRLP